MRVTDKHHFFGKHPKGLHNGKSFQKWINNFKKAVDSVPPHIEIVNATPNSALRCFPMMELAEALRWPNR